MERLKVVSGAFDSVKAAGGHDHPCIGPHKTKKPQQTRGRRQLAQLRRTVDQMPPASNGPQSFQLLNAFVFQVMDRPCQVSQSTRLDGIFSFLEVYYCAPGHSRLAREQFIRKFLRLRPDLI
jgi:hypothetical protein